MLNVTFGQLRDENFKRGMAKLGNCAQFKSPKVAYNVAKICGRFVEEAKLADEQYQKLIDTYAKKDEKGELEPHQGKPGTFFIPAERQEEWAAKVAEYNAIAFEIDRPKLPLDELMVANLSPIEIHALSGLLEFNEAEPVPPVKLAKS